MLKVWFSGFRVWLLQCVQHFKDRTVKQHGQLKNEYIFSFWKKLMLFAKWASLLLGNDTDSTSFNGQSLRFYLYQSSE